MSCYDDCERDGRRAAERGYFRGDERELYENGRYADPDTCSREFHDAYDAERLYQENRDDERRQEEDAIERAAEHRRQEQERYEYDMEQAYNEQQN